MSHTPRDPRRVGHNFTHGYSGYQNYDCRCEICRAGNRTHMAAYRAERARRRREVEALGQRYIVEGITHGVAGYNSHSCRCDVCRKAKLANNKAYKLRKAEVGAA